MEIENEIPFAYKSRRRFSDYNRHSIASDDIENLGNSLIGAIDAGTSSVRFMVFSAQSKALLAHHQLPVSFYYPEPEWVEQDAMQISERVNECIDEVTKKLVEDGREPSDIVAVGITNQRETTVLWDKITGKPLYNAIVWMDNRTKSTIHELLSTKTNKSVDQLKELCGLPINPYFSALKYRWLIDNIPEVREAIKEERCLFGTIDSWLIWNLTGGPKNGIHMTDVTNASRTMLMNINTLQWDPVLISFFNIPEETLPEIRSSSEMYSRLAEGPLRNIPITGCIGDQQAALIGQLCFAEGQTKCTYGTGCFILTNTGSNKIMSKHGLLTTVAYQLGKDSEPVYALEGSITTAGAIFTWLRDNLKVIDDLNNINTLAAEVSSSNGVSLVPAFQGLYAPYWDPNARGLICGLTMETDRRHIIRAALEAVCFQTRDIMESIYKDCGLRLPLLKVDGGMAHNNLLLQLQADTLGINIVRQFMLESTAFGAAVVAAIADGVALWDPEEIKQKQEVFPPNNSEKERCQKYDEWKAAVRKCMSGCSIQNDS